MRYMGLDIGTKRIGVAISDPMFVTAQGLTVIQSSGIRKDIEAVLDIAQENCICLIVCGLPKNMNGTVGIQAEHVLRFIDKMKMKSAIPIITWDERLSTKAADDIMIKAGTRRENRKKKIDQVAASIILQSYLDNLQDR